MNLNHSLLRIHPAFCQIHLCVTGQACHHQSHGFFLFYRAAILCKSNFLYCQSFSSQRKIEWFPASILTSNSASKNSYTKTEPLRLSFEIIPNNTTPVHADQSNTIAQDPINYWFSKVFPVSNYFQF